MICDCGLTAGCFRCRPFNFSFSLLDNSEIVTVLVSREELNKWNYEWCGADKPIDPIKVKGILNKNAVIRI